MKKFFLILIFAFAVGFYIYNLDSIKKTKETPASQPAPSIPELPGKLYLLYRSDDVTMYLFEYEGKRYVYTIGGTYSHPTATMVEHKSP